MWDRNLRAEAAAFARGTQWVKLRENRRSLKVPAWDVLVKEENGRRGTVVVTLVSLNNMYYV